MSDDFANLVISNCVINLSPDKKSVFQEALRVLKPGGRLMVSDIVLTRPLPDFIQESVRAYLGCVSGAMLKDDYIATIREVGFQQISVESETTFSLDWFLSDPTIKATIDSLNLREEQLNEINQTVVSIQVKASKV